MRTLRQYGLLTLALTLPLLPALAAEPGIDHEKQYRACIALTYRQPMKAFETAENWARRDGGAPARHCAAMALLEAREYDRAARRLEALAATLAADHVPSPGDILAQAANVWLLDGRADLALRAIELALQYDPDRAVYLIDRGRIRAEQGDHAAALRDLDQALALNPDDDDAAAFRASALRHLGRADEALAAIDQALILNPNNPSARLERGILRLQRGDREGARADWLHAAVQHRGTPAGDAAQARLQQMELKPK